MLTQQWGDFNKAPDYIKDCALSSLTGDCKLIEKMYIDNQSNSICYINTAKTKIQYFDENENKTINSKAQLGRKLANNLQNSLGDTPIAPLFDDSQGAMGVSPSPNKFLENYDIQMWNQHIFDLSNLQYQKKIINNLNIPLQ
jgi:hypothetical protein